MASLKDTTRRACSTLLCFVLLCTTTGCNLADYLRPDLNHGSNIRAFPDEEPITDDEVMPGQNVAVWPNGSPHNDSYTYTHPNPIVNAENFEATPVDTIGCTEYSQYLQEQVYDELVTFIQSLGSDVSDKIYIRCGHTGYDLIPGTGYQKKSGWSSDTAGKAFNTNKVVGGDSLVTLANDWVGDLERNKEHQAAQVKAAQDSLTTTLSEADFDKSWLELSEATISTTHYKMFGREGANFATLRDYYNAIATDPYHNIPNYTFYIKTGETTYDTLTFNKVSTKLVEQYNPGVEISTLDKLFRTYSQYDTRGREMLDQTKQDSDSLLRYYLDGYNKTIIFVATVPGGNLKETLGEDNYRKVFNIVNGAYNCTMCSEITAIKPEEPTPSASPNPSASPSASAEPTGPDYSGFTVVPAGTKGVD